jgi:hypothetical protein
MSDLKSSRSSFPQTLLGNLGNQFHKTQSAVQLPQTNRQE